MIYFLIYFKIRFLMNFLILFPALILIDLIWFFSYFFSCSPCINMSNSIEIIFIKFFSYYFSIITNSWFISTKIVNLKKSLDKESVRIFPLYAYMDTTIIIWSSYHITIVYFSPNGFCCRRKKRMPTGPNICLIDSKQLTVHQENKKQNTNIGQDMVVYIDLLMWAWHGRIFNLVAFNFF